MDFVKSLTVRERTSNLNLDYDVSLLRLKCLPKNLFHWASPNLTTPDPVDNPPVFAGKFCNAPGSKNLLAIANEDGKILLQDISHRCSDDTQELPEGIQAHNNAIFDIAWMPKETKLVSVSGERNAALWQVKDGELTKLSSFVGHTHSIKSVSFRPEDKAVFATGSRDGSIKIWDTRANYSSASKADDTISNAHVSKMYRASRKTNIKNVGLSVTTLQFQDDFNLISGSDGDGELKVWDLRKIYSTHKKFPVAKHVLLYGGKSHTYCGFTSVLVDPYGLNLYASCVDNVIYSYNLTSYNPNPVARYYGHGKTNTPLSFFVKACLSPDGKYLITGSNDKAAYIWATKKPGYPIIELTGHREEVTCVAWCDDVIPKLVTFSDDCYHRLWEVEPDQDFVDDNQIVGMSVRYQPKTSNSPRKCSEHADLEAQDTMLGQTSEEISENHHKETHDERSLLVDESLINNTVPGSKELRAIPCPSTPKNTSLQKYIIPGTSNVPSSSSCSSREPFSPTVGLPNFVIDGIAPHLHVSPQKSKENSNWLAQLTQAKQKRKIVDTSEDECSSPKNTKKTPKSVKRKKFATVNTPKLDRKLLDFCESAKDSNFHREDQKKDEEKSEDENENIHQGGD
ncbi:protein lethal(2)denticleless isoform X1 [Trichogramma pretiosum]|uniref:protein lethal(2)denticleless isoform X1 n=1 Tax=Trichogramma pretiosum TaxID=7493 RepID=UPI0006C9C487|nr:protein lethal(2)denticleless isoform X1 [Trichogramma pretiosum]